MRRLILGYYLATIGFIALDALAGWNVRIAALDGHPGWRAAYYGFCLACLGLMVWRPVLTALVALLESSVNFLLLLLDVLLPLFTLGQRVGSEAPGGIGFSFGWFSFVNFLLTGGILIATFHRALWSLRTGEWLREGTTRTDP